MEARQRARLSLEGRSASDGFGTPMLSAVVGMSLLAHAAAIGVLLMLKPAPPLAAPLEVIEISVMPDEVLARPRANNPSGALPPHASADVSTAPPASLTRPDVIPTVSSPDWSFRVNLGRSFDVAHHAKSGSQTPAPAFDRLTAELDCLAVGGSVGGPSERTRRGHPPCLTDDPPLRASGVALVPADPSRQGESGHDNDYRTFKPIVSFYNDIPLPDAVAPANRALKKWIARLFQ